MTLLHQVCVLSSMTQYLIVHQRSLYNHPPLAGGLLPRARILVSREGDYELEILLKTIYRKRYRLFRKCTLQSCCDLPYARLQNAQYHVTWITCQTTLLSKHILTGFDTLLSFVIYSLFTCIYVIYFPLPPTLVKLPLVHAPPHQNSVADSNRTGVSISWSLILIVLVSISWSLILIVLVSISWSLVSYSSCTSDKLCG